MTKSAALYQFFSSFEMPAYSASSVPDDVMFPYLTYTPVTAAWGSEQVSITVNLWFYTTSETIPNAKAQELSKAIGLGGVILPCDGGAIWLKRGDPWCNPIKDESDNTRKGRYINVTAEYMTPD